MATTVRKVFLQAQVRQGRDRARYLDQVCGEDQDFRRRVQGLLQATDGANRYCEGLAVRLSKAPARPTDEVPAQFGAYRPLRLIGQGGMGAVYLAERIDQQFEKQVAIKVLPTSVDQHAADRFVNERQILAGLVHPNIARLLDGGLTDDGRPYFVMDYVDGLPIDVYCDQRRLTVGQRLKLFFQVCSAVQYAHSKLVLHRDLKPSNILVDGHSNGHGVVQLLDFGVGELLAVGQSIGDSSTQVPLTPSYASPEMLRGEGATTASDVYSLGVVLYRMLTGLHPMELDEIALPDLVAAVLDTDSPLASERVRRITDDADRTREIAASRGLSPRRLSRRLRGDLDAILAKTLNRDLAGRYQTVGDLSADIHAYLDHRPVQVMPATTRYRLQRFFQRYRLPVTLSALSLLMVLSLAIVATRFALQTRTQAVVVVAERDRAEAVSDFLLSLFAYANPRHNAKGTAISAKELIDLGVARIQRLQSQPDTQAALLGLAANAYGHMDQLDLSRNLFEQALQLERASANVSKRKLSSTLTRLARIEADLSDWEAAERHVAEAISLSEELRQPADMARGLLLLGSMHLTQGDFAATEQRLNEALTVARQTDRQRSDKLDARILSHLGQVALARGELDRAEAQHREALQLRAQSTGRETIDQADSLLQLGQVLRARGDLAGAEVKVRAADSIHRRLLFADSIPNATTARVWAQIKRDLGDLDEAERLAQNAIGIWRRIGASDHPELAYALETLAAVHLTRASPATARPLLEESVAISERAQPDHPQTAQRRSQLEACLHQLAGSAKSGV